MKNGRNISHIDFKIEKKEQSEPIENETEIELIETKKEYSVTVTELFYLLPIREQIEIRKSDLKKLLQEHSYEMLKADIKYCNEQKPEKYWAYFLKSLKSGHFSSAELEKKKISEEKKRLRAKLEELEKIEITKFEKIDEDTLTESEKKYLERAKKVSKNGL